MTGLNQKWQLRPRIFVFAKRPDRVTRAFVVLFGQKRKLLSWTQKSSCFVLIQRSHAPLNLVNNNASISVIISNKKVRRKVSVNSHWQIQLTFEHCLRSASLQTELKKSWPRYHGKLCCTSVKQSLDYSLSLRSESVVLRDWNGMNWRRMELTSF